MTSLTKFKAQYEQVRAAVTAARMRVTDTQVAKGFEQRDATLYTAGYMESYLIQVLAELPKARQEKIIADLAKIRA